MSKKPRKETNLRNIIILQTDYLVISGKVFENEVQCYFVFANKIYA